MCSNYIAADGERLLQHFGVVPAEFGASLEIYPGYFAPIIRPLREDGNAERLECVAAYFGMVPLWADLKLARRTYNARTETVGSKSSYRNAWQKRQFCVVPLDAFFEPCYETGRAIRWKIAHRTGRPLGIAGIWDWHPQGGLNGEPLISFSMLTINADQHELMRRFHKPNEEKRMVVVLEPQTYQNWLHTPLEQVARFFEPYPADQLVARPAPKPPGRNQRKEPSAAANENMVGGRRRQKRASGSG